MKTEKEIKAEAVIGFVDMMMGAFESGFVDRNHANLSELYQVARNHVRDEYGVNVDDIVKTYGIEFAKECGLKLKGES